MGNPVIGIKIRSYRKQAKMTQQQLADAIGVKHAIISKYENGTIEPSLTQVQKIAEVLHVSIFDFFSDSAIDEFNKQIEIMKTFDPNIDVSQFEEHITQDVLENMQYNEWWAAEANADKFLVESFKVFNDKYLTSALLNAFSVLSRRGKIEAVLRVEELYYNHRFNPHNEDL